MITDDQKWWIATATQAALWIIGATWAWARMTSKINGLGSRTKVLDSTCSTTSGKVDTMEKSQLNQARDLQDVSSRMGRVEKGIDDIRDQMQTNHLEIGSQLADIQKSVSASDAATRERLAKSETNIEASKEAITRLEQAVDRKHNGS